MSNYVALIAPPLLLVGGAVWLDLHTRRGYGLALLALALLALSVWGAISFEQALRRSPSSESFGVAFTLAVYLLIGLAFALLLWIGALVEASVARQGWWIAGLVASAALPGLLIVLDVVLDLGARLRLPRQRHGSAAASRPHRDDLCLQRQAHRSFATSAIGWRLTL